MNPLLVSILDVIRAHPGFAELQKAVERPRITPMKRSQTADAANAHARWAYESGQLAQHDAWLAMLTGKPVEQE